jgi:hypothetical protein
MWDCICVHAATAENVKRKEAANVARTRVENIVSSFAILAPICAARSYN